MWPLERTQYFSKTGAGQYSVRGLMIVIATGFIPFSPPPIVSTMVKKEAILCGVLLKELQENMDRCTGHRYITEIILKTALNTMKLIKQSLINVFLSQVKTLLESEVTFILPYANLSENGDVKKKIYFLVKSLMIKPQDRIPIKIN